MDTFDLIESGLEQGHDLGHHDAFLNGQEGCDAALLSTSLAAAHIANGMDPAAAALQARLDADLIGPLLF